MLSFRIRVYLLNTWVDFPSNMASGKRKTPYTLEEPAEFVLADSDSEVNEYVRWRNFIQ